MTDDDVDNDLQSKIENKIDIGVGTCILLKNTKNEGDAQYDLGDNRKRIRLNKSFNVLE